MNGELLAVLDHLEREKGIKREVLIEAVQMAILSAAKKTIANKLDEEIAVKVDGESGKIQVFSGDQEVTSPEFGRIAAQTAKQLIIQRIREAEREVVFNEYQKRVGEITSGSVYRFERGNIVVDLGKTEALLPRKEQSPKEEYRQGERIRAYILQVKRADSGPQIILSRAHPGLVRRLFELEVPEIYEGIVEIKSVARQPGERSKIAVWSKDEKVDCVGACVGMRGYRVKNIVRELHGEKIDIVRWNEDIREFIAAALSPAQILEMKIDKKESRAEVLVEEDQLSLAIGKRGQNVRLACKLTAWNIDIRAKAPELTPQQQEMRLRKLPAIGVRTARALMEAGFKSYKSIAQSEPKAIMKVKGIGKKKAEAIIEGARKLAKKTDK